MVKFELLILVDLWKEESIVELIDDGVTTYSYKENYELLVRNLDLFDFKKVVFFNTTFKKNHHRKIDIESCFKDYLNKNNKE